MANIHDDTSNPMRPWWLLAIGVVLILGNAGCTQVPASTATEPPATATTAATSTPSETPTTAPTPTPLFTPTWTPTPTPTPAPTSTLQPTSTPTLTPTPRPRPTAVPPEVLATQYPQLAPILNNPEVADAYKQLAVAYEEGGQQQALAVAQQYGLISPEGYVRADLVLDTNDTASTVAQLEAMGIVVVGTHDNVVQIAVPPALLMSSANEPSTLLNQLSGMEHVVGVQPPQ